MPVQDESEKAGEPGLQRWEIRFTRSGDIVASGQEWQDAAGLVPGASLLAIDSFASQRASAALSEAAWHLHGSGEYEPVSLSFQFTGRLRPTELKGDVVALGGDLFSYAPVEISSLTGEVQQLEKLVNSLPDACLVHSAGVPLFANRQCARLLGLTKVSDVLAMQDVLALFSGDSRDLMSFKAGGGSSDNSEFMINLAAGDTTMPLTCRASSINWDGEPATLLTMLPDSRSRAGKNQAGKWAGLFSQVFNLTPNAILMIRMSDSSYIDINSACLHLLGLSRDEVIGRSVRDVDIWVDPSFHNWLFSQLRTHSVLRDVPAKMVGRGGLVRDMILVAETIETEEGPVLILIGRDVTEDFEREFELQRSRDEAEVANRTKSEFLANMSHELRTPLNAILGFSEILTEEHLGPIGQPRYKEYARDIYTSGSHLLDIINDILDLSKIESGRLEIALQCIDLSEVASECIRFITGKAEEAGVELRTRLDESLPVSLDRRLTKQIIINLMSNAVKFTPKGGQVDLMVEQTSNGGGRVTVADTGIGMTRSDIEVAMTPFGQVDSQLGRMYDGSGLGLPLVAAFCEKQGMNLEINSSPGQGTQISITIPPALICELDDPSMDDMLI